MSSSPTAEVTGWKQTANLGVHMAAIVGFCMGFVLCWNLPKYVPAVWSIDGDYEVTPEGEWNNDQWKWLLAMFLCLVASVISMHMFCPRQFEPQGYAVPLYPYLPAASLFINTFLLGQLDEKSYKRCVGEVFVTQITLWRLLPCDGDLISAAWSNHCEMMF